MLMSKQLWSYANGEEKKPMRYSTLPAIGTSSSSVRLNTDKGKMMENVEGGGKEPEQPIGQESLQDFNECVQVFMSNSQWALRIIMQLALCGLPPKYNTIKVVINYSKSMEMEQVQATLHACKAELWQISKTTKSLLYLSTKVPTPKPGAGHKAPQPTTLGTAKMKKKKWLKCTFCHYTGHIYNKCQQRLGIGKHAMTMLDWE